LIKSSASNHWGTFKHSRVDSELESFGHDARPTHCFKGNHQPHHKILDNDDNDKNKATDIIIQHKIFSFQTLITITDSIAKSSMERSMSLQGIQQFHP